MHCLSGKLNFVINKPSLMLMNKFTFAAALLLIIARCCSQDFTWPLGGPSGLTGNYAEIRPNHFHSGIDLATNGKNLPIYSIGDGYVSRIKMSSYGYGKVIYITHPSGLVSVYAHQEKFTDEIFRFVRAVQEINETFEIEVFPRPDELPVKKGQLIGFSGNSGNSTGPHLHFEIRDEKTEIPLDPFLYLPLNDTIKPELKSLAFYTYNKENILEPYYFIQQKNFRDTLKIKSCSFIALNMFDRCVTGGNPNQVKEVKIYLDSNLIYQHLMSGIHFDNNREVNGFYDYNLKQTQKVIYQKCFPSKMNFLSIYQNKQLNGEIFLSDTGLHRLEICISDIKNNAKNEILYIKKKWECQPVHAKLFSCNTKQNFQEGDLLISISDSSFFNDYYFKSNSIGSNLFLSPVYNFTSSEIYLNKGIHFKLPYNSKSLIPANKQCLVLVNGNQVKQYLGGKIEGLYVMAESKTTQSVALFYDTVAPILKPLAWIKNTKTIKTRKRIGFAVSDNLSGIDLYRIEINGKWVLSEFDHKSQSIYFENNINYWQKQNEIKVEVLDKQGNITVRFFKVVT